MTAETYKIIAYPRGARRVVATVHSSSAEGAIAAARTQSVMRGEYVDVERAGVCIAVVGEDGAFAMDSSAPECCWPAA
jgi:hypothetical protein